MARCFAARQTISRLAAALKVAAPPAKGFVRVDTKSIRYRTVLFTVRPLRVAAELQDAIHPWGAHQRRALLLVSDTTRRLQIDLHTVAYAVLAFGTVGITLTRRPQQAFINPARSALSSIAVSTTRRSTIGAVTTVGRTTCRWG